MNQLLWYYAELEKQKCIDDTVGKDNDGREADFVIGASRRKSQVKLSYSLKLIDLSIFVFLSNDISIWQKNFKIKNTGHSI